ncbi:uncharacterized protein LOC119682476 [Teleopsis dalmanni]|uniref:uncharacterized protein LOC119682476 n=1 Tax=Teleopsis dalmanni TaxID=139649 RepID=UPI0018CD15DF|nr:uncharacterized protein LOC119682476 [Teleopsis dalmanni]
MTVRSTRLVISRSSNKNWLLNSSEFSALVICLFEFTNIKCMPIDKEFADFDYCYLKSINRSYKYMSLKVKLFKVPITNVTVICLFEFTNIKCMPLDKEFADFDYCYLKSVNRSYKYMSLKVKLFKVPITSVTIRYALLKKESGYKPFLYNISLDACEFLKSQKNPVTKYFHSFFREHSNMNHTCPYDHDLIVEKLNTNFLNSRFLVLPFPSGEYALYTTWIAYNIPRADVYEINTNITDIMRGSDLRVSDYAWEIHKVTQNKCVIM